MKIRKLYPFETDQSSDNCYGFCDPACPYNCYDYLLSPPPPPLEHLSGGQHHHILPYLIVAVSLLAGFFIVVTYYVIISKSCDQWLRRRRLSSGDDENRQFVDENRVDHAIWYIATVGLHQSIINSITVWRYSKDEGLVEGTECSVCLNEFHDGETLRLLPKCNHAFHILCIDTWLRSHTNCPLCRAGIILDAGNAPTAVPSGQNSGNGAPVLGNQREDYGNSGEAEEVGESGDGGGKEGENLLVIRDRESARIKRSVSMNLAAAGQKDSEKRCSNSSIDRYLHLSPVPMKRSSSCCWRLSFSSRRRIATVSQLLDFPSFCFITSEKPRKRL